jgi:hypothetical protein
MRKFWFSSGILACAAAAALLLGACKADDGAAGPQAASQTGGAGSGAAPVQQPNSAPQQTVTTHADGVRRVTPAEAQRMMEAGEAIVVDVRPKANYDQGHIKGSVSIPRDEMAARLSELPKDKLVVFYCA